MKARTKETLKDGFGCLINNAAAMRGAKNGPLWLTIVMFVVAILLPVLPLFISATNTNGSDFIKSNTYGLERYVTKTAQDLKDAGYEFNLGEDHHLTVKGNNFDYTDYVSFDYTNEKKPEATDIYRLGQGYVDGVTGQLDFTVFVSNELGSSYAAKSINNFIAAKTYDTVSIYGDDTLLAKLNNETDGAYYNYKLEVSEEEAANGLVFKANYRGTDITVLKKGSFEYVNEDGEEVESPDYKITFVDDHALKEAKRWDENATTEEGKSYNQPSYFIAFKDTIYVCVGYEGKLFADSSGGNFSKIAAKENCLAWLLEVRTDKGVIVAPSMTNAEYTDGVVKNLKKALNETYNSVKYINAFATAGIFLGVCAGLTIFMGFLMWIMTRGKNNPNNYFSPWLTIKISARLALSPAIITFVVGLFLPQYASMLFILALGLRVMWISMKELRPVQQ